MNISIQLLNKILTENYHDLFQFVVKKIHDTKTAKEIISEAHSRIWQHQSAIQNEAHIRPYLFVIARNLCIDHLKQPRNVSYEEVKHTLPLKDEPKVYKDFANKEMYTWLKKEIPRLPDRLKAVAELWMEELDNDAIAERLNLHESYVRTIKTRIIEKLMKARKDQGFNPLMLLLLCV
jgi:RNA polymerase sigma factor (sigma-70 family)